jgi:predicted lactoylglutathione lyase
MAKRIFINLPVTDLKKAQGFYIQMGLVLNAKYTDDSAACMVLSDSIYVMLLSRQKFGEFTNKEIIDPVNCIGVINSILLASTKEVENTYKAALQAGGTEAAPYKDYGFMQMQSLADPDGNVWEILYIDESKLPND